MRITRRDFIQTTANASLAATGVLCGGCGNNVEVSPVLEATALGAGFLAGLGVGTWGSLDEVGATWRPRTVVEPSGRPSDRTAWLRARERSRGWIADLSAIEF